MIQTSGNYILIVEDDVKFAKSLCKIAESNGFDYILAETAKEALIHIESQCPLAIILDMKLPDTDGITVLDYVKNDIQTRHVPIYVLSAGEEYHKEAFSKGAVNCLTKPITKNALDSIFAGVINQKQDVIKSILVIEDDQPTQRAIEKLLSNKHSKITVASNGTEGIEYVKHNQYDCVILDLQLPDMNGFDWLGHYEVLEKDNLPPVIVYTSRELSKKEVQRLEQFTDSIIVKGAHSPNRLIDEVSLFLHSMEESLTDEQKKRINKQTQINESLEAKKVLLVDDDMRNVFALSKMLKKYNMEVVIAENGQVALDELENHDDISIIIMDIMMPVMDGYQAIEHIRHHPFYNEIPIIALTAQTMSDEKEKCLNAGANDYMAKPVNVDTLLALMKVLFFTPEKVA